MTISPLDLKAFTIIELLIVIVVIGILATIVLNTVVGIRERAQDTKKRTDIAAAIKALESYNVEQGTFVVSGYGSNGGGYGWFNWDNNNPASYPDSVVNGLNAAGYVTEINSYQFASYGPGELYMIYPCSALRQWAIFADLDQPTAEDDATMDRWINGGCGTTQKNTYGMDYVEFSVATY